MHSFKHKSGEALQITDEKQNIWQFYRTHKSTKITLTFHYPDDPDQETALLKQSNKNRDFNSKTQNLRILGHSLKDYT